MPHAIPKVSAEEYLRRERASEARSEYWSGEIFAMAGGSARHSLITVNVIAALHRLLKGGTCVPYDSNLRVDVAPTGLYTYPDATVVCGPPEFTDTAKDMITNPRVIIEVLSDSTEAYDRGTKFEHYRGVSSLVEYVLISQKIPLVEIFSREQEGRWRLTPVSGIHGSARLDSIGTDIAMAEIYYRVEFDAVAPLKVAAPIKQT